MISVIRWKDYETMIEEANDVRYGLASGIYTSIWVNAMERRRSGWRLDPVWINQYFISGRWRRSAATKAGIGREYCRDTLNLYSHLKVRHDGVRSAAAMVSGLTSRWQARSNRSAPAHALQRPCDQQLHDLVGAAIDLLDAGIDEDARDRSIPACSRSRRTAGGIRRRSRPASPSTSISPSTP